jgi:hypothetical protein
MRDSVRLRHHLVRLAALPALLSTLACSAPPTPAVAEAKKGETKRAAGKEGKNAVADAAKTPRESPPERSSPQPTPSEPAPVDRFSPIPGDPPYIDGYNPEEETCPSGNWCGSIASAVKVAPGGENAPKELGCPTRIIGAHPDPSPITGKEFEGLSPNRQMQGALNRHRTEKEHTAGKDDLCCYHWFEYCSGRPLRGDEGDVVARVQTRDDWQADEPSPVLAELGPAERAALADAWLEDALAEHASVASFARATLELMAVGAPPELLGATQAAARDEIDHARRCFALASAYAGRPLGPGALVSPAPREAGLAALACATFVEGCVGETIAALVAERALASASDPTVRATLRVIARDEARHAALAWRTVAWAIDRGGDDVVAALREVASAPRPNAAIAARRGTWWHAHGRLDPDQLRAATEDAWSDAIAPLLATLLDRRATRTGASAVV